MPAKITIESSIVEAADLWIDRQVLRIGSHPDMDICLPTSSVAGHAATLEFRGNQYHLHQRGDSEVLLDGSIVKGNARLNHGSVVRLATDVELVLQIDGDPQPVAKSNTSLQSGDTPGEAPSAEAAESQDSGSDESMAGEAASSFDWKQICVIFLCVVACGLMLLKRNSGFANPADAKKTFHELVRQSLDSEQVPGVLLRELQQAESSFVRGDRLKARDRFASLRDQLASYQARFVEREENELLDLLSHVQSRLGQLN